MSSVLIVEDDESYRKVLERKLEGKYFVHGVATLNEALRIFGTLSFDAVLLDVGLPDSDQYATVSRMKKSYPKCTIVVISGNENPDIVSACIKDSASSYLVKGRDDQNMDTFAYAIDKAMSNNRITQKMEQVRKMIDNGTEI